MHAMVWNLKQLCEAIFVIDVRFVLKVLKVPTFNRTERKKESLILRQGKIISKVQK